MTEVVERRKIDAHELRHYLSLFISDQQNSYDVEHRWLAAYAADLMAQAYNVKTGNHDTIRRQVHEFRLREIDTARAKLNLDADKLQVEEAKLLREIEQIAVTGDAA